MALFTFNVNKIQNVVPSTYDIFTGWSCHGRVLHLHFQLLGDTRIWQSKPENKITTLASFLSWLSQAEIKKNIYTKKSSLCPLKKSSRCGEYSHKKRFKSLLSFFGVRGGGGLCWHNFYTHAHARTHLLYNCQPVFPLKCPFDNHMVWHLLSGVRRQLPLDVLFLQQEPLCYFHIEEMRSVSSLH